MYARIYDAEMGPYPPRMPLAMQTTNPRLTLLHRAGRYRSGGPPFIHYKLP